MVKGVRYGGSVVRLEGERLMARWVLGVQCTIWWAPKWAPRHSSAQVGRGGTARRPLAVLSLLIAASRMARYQVTKMSAPAVQIADRFLRRGDHL